MTPRRICVVGAGAVGGHFGGLLAHAGHAVTFVARGANLQALQRSGLRIERPEGPLHLAAVHAVADPAAAGPADVVLVCVKSRDTRDVAAAIRPIVGPDTAILSLQNGVENEAILAEALGLPPLLVGLTPIAAALTAPGVVVYSGRGVVHFGEPDGTTSPRARLVEAVFVDAGIPCRLRDDVVAAAWEKLAWNAAFNTVTTLADASVGAVLAVPHTAALIRDAMTEVDAVATSLGIPVRRRRLPKVLADSAAEMPDFATSMLQDRRRGRPLEHDAITGAVLRAAARTGVPVPVVRTLHALLCRLDPGAR